MSTLTEQFARDGYVIVEDLLSQEEVQNLKKEIANISRGERGLIKGLESFSLQDSDDYITQKYLCFHFPHKMSDYIRHISVQQPNIVNTLTKIVGPNVKFMQSMFFIKAPGKLGQAWHQDEYYIPTRDRSLTASWIAIDDATIENGCLWVIPGSHKTGIIYPNRPHNNPQFDAAGESYDFEPFKEEDAVPVQLKSGSAVFFNGYLLHRSLPNNSKNSFRRALANHYMSAESFLPWNWDGRLAPTEDNRDVLMVAGVDPYAKWKPVVNNLTYPYIRADSVNNATKFNERN